MNKFLEMQAFAAAIETGSMTEAAIVLGASKSVVSKRIHQLESRLGIALLERGKNLSATLQGEQFYKSCTKILEELAQAEQTARSDQQEMSGQFRIIAPMAFTTGYLAPLLAKFSCRYPELVFDIESDDKKINLHESNFDLAIRLGTLVDSSLIARPISTNHHVLCASPAYLKQHGTPDHPDDLAHHQGLLYMHREANGMLRLPCQGKLGSFRIQPQMRTNNGHILLEAARAGVGIAILPTFLAASAIERGELNIILPNHTPPGGNIAALYRQSHRRSPVLNALVDFLRSEIGTPAFWDKKILPQLGADSTKRSKSRTRKSSST